MVKLNDYLYSGDTVLKILHNYIRDLKKSAEKTHNLIDLTHADFLTQIQELLEHNDFLTTQSQQIREFYKYMAAKYPYLAFTFKGRIKSLLRAEEKFNGYIVEYVYDHYVEHGTYPSVRELRNKLNFFRDLIAYRIVISLPDCYVKEGEDKTAEEIRLLYEIANTLPEFLKSRGFRAEVSGKDETRNSDLLENKVNLYYRDYISKQSANGYQSLHITFYDVSAHCYIEVQLRTKEMDDYAEIGPANHLGYEQHQEKERARRDQIPEGEYLYFDEAYERGMQLQQMNLTNLKVNMFAAASSTLINDGCGLYHGRLILPYEHLSRFQNDLID